MSAMRFARPLAVFALLVASLHARAQSAPPLPKAFGGWVQTSSPKSPQLAQPLSTAFQEFRLAGSSEALYQQNGNHLDLSVFAFPDYTGACGAFTFLREPSMLPQSVGNEAASGNDRVVFFTANLVVDAKFDRVSGMTLSQLRELAAALPKAPAPGNPPTVQKYLPQQGLIPTTVHYAIGPQALALTGSPLTPEQVAFPTSPEIATAQYKTDAGQALITIVAYPTPQIAAEQLKKIEPQFVNAAQPAQQIKRTYSMLVLTSGNASPAEAKSLLASVNYDADVTWNEATKPNPKDNVGSLLVNVIVLSGILVGFMFVLGIFFGGFRILYYKLNPSKAAAHEESNELIRLNLR